MRTAVLIVERINFNDHENTCNKDSIVAAGDRVVRARERRDPACRRPIQHKPRVDHNPVATVAGTPKGCPRSVASKAAVYVLDRAGYIKVRDGENGFTAIVQHAVPTSQDPQCMDAEGTRTFLPRYLKVAEWRAQGKSADEIKLLVADSFAKGIFRPPAKPGIDYMLSSENFTPNAKGEVVHFPPHVMFYAPYLTNADLGLGGPLGQDGNPDGPAFVAGEGTPQALIIVPVGSHSSAKHE